MIKVTGVCRRGIQLGVIFAAITSAAAITNASNETAEKSISVSDQAAASVSRDAHGSSLAITNSDGASIVIQQTGNQILQPQVLSMPGTSNVVTTWQEQINGQVKSMYSFSLDGQNFSRPLESTGLIRLRYANFDPLNNVPAVPPALTAGQALEDESENVYIVQFIIPPLESMLNEISALGATPYIYVADACEIVRMTGAVRDQVAALPYVRWVGVFQPAYKLDETILPQAAENAQDLPLQRYSIMVFQRGPAQQQSVANRIAALGGQVQMITPEGFRMQAFLTGPQLLQVAQMSEVHFADPMGEAGTDMDIARQIGGAVPMLSGLAFTGQGVRGEVMDSGVRQTHQAFQGPALLIHSPAASSASHGTSTTGIVFGNGAANALGTGMLPNREQGIFFQYTHLSSQGGSVSRYTATGQLVDPAGPYRAVFQSNSWGNALTTAYQPLSAEMDDIIFDFDILICQSQSNANSQNSRPEAWAKNILSVGGIAHQNTLTRVDDTISGASFGPAADQRVKPDLSHFYENVLCPTSSSDTAYTTGFGGTSAATPITAGHFGLLFQMWHQQVFPGFGGAASVFLSRPHAATAKAMMINSAFRYTWGQGGANNGLVRARQGWGMADVAKLYNDRLKTFIVNETDLLTPGGSNEYQFNVAAGEPELRVTMVYADPMGPTSANLHRINDLSLRVTSPSGTIYWGNNGLNASNVSTPGGVSNTIDTVENVFLPNPQAGTWSATVFGDVIVQDSHVETPAMDADYALVVAGGGPILPCLEDITGDGNVNIDDLLAVINGWGPCVGDACPADVTGNNVVDIDDLLAVINGWGPCN